MPHDLPPWQTVYYHFRRWQRLGVWTQVIDTLSAHARTQAGRGAPKHLAVDSQSVPTTSKRGERGYDGGKQAKGRKRHIVVDSQGTVVAVVVTPADVSDAQGAYQALASALGWYHLVCIVIAESAYDREGLLEWLLQEWYVGLDGVGRSGVQGFEVLPRRWLVARRFAWLLGCRWLSRCDDAVCAVEEVWIRLACVRWLVRRLAKEDS